MKLFDLNKWEKDGEEELASHRAKLEKEYSGSGKPHIWVLSTTAICLIASAVFLAANGFMESRGIGNFGDIKMFYIGAAIMGLVGIAYGLGIMAGRTAASTRSISFAENVITMICAILIALVSVSAAVVRLTM